MKKIVLLNCLVVVICSVSFADTDPNLVGWWKMDGPTEGEDIRFVKDYSGFGNDGTMGSSDTWIQGGGMDFDGGAWGASGITFANAGADLVADLGLTDQVTVSFVATWASGEKTGTNYPYDGRDSNDIRMLSMECTSSNHICNHFGGTNSWAWEAFNDQHVNFIFSKNGAGKTWGDMIMITETVDFSTGNYNLYVDGQLYASASGKVGSFADLSTFTIGRTLWAEMEGKMSDFRIYNRALSMSEIIDLTKLIGNRLTVKIDPNFLDSEELVPSVGEHQYYGAWPINLSAEELIANSPDVYKFDHWIGDVEDPNSSTTKITLTEDKEVTAVYLPSDNFVGWWKMDGPTEGEDVKFVKDYSGFGNDGTMGSSDTWIVGGGLDFDGGSDGGSGIVFANSGADLVADMALTNQVTVSYWGTWDGPVGSDPRFPSKSEQYPFDGLNLANEPILSAVFQTDNHLLNYFGGTNSWALEAFNDTHANFIFANGVPAKTWGDWIMITETVNFDTGDYVLYVDGRLYASEGGQTGSFASLANFTIGRVLLSEMEGDMKDFRIYNSELTPEEVASIWESSVTLKAYSPSPEHQSKVILDSNSADVTLSWRAGYYATEHDIYFGTDETAVANAILISAEYVGSQSETSYDITITETGTYYWRVDEVNNVDVWTGVVWSFDIPQPGQATNPTPANDATSIIIANLSWIAGTYATSHDVYFGTNPTPDSNEFQGNQTTTTFDPGILDNGTTYYWCIDEKNDNGTTTGIIWNFTTKIAEMSQPVLWLKMDGPTEGEDIRFVKDYSGFGNDGTMGSSDAWIGGGGIDFDGGSWGASGIVFANNGADLIADMGLADKVTVSYLGTWDDGEATGTNYPFDGRASDGTTRLLSSECSADSYIRNHFGGTDMWCWSAFNDTSANFIFAKNGLGKTWGDMIMITETVDFSTGNYNLYVDGQLYASEGGKIGSFAGLATFTIGRTLWCEMEGKMSDFRIYNRVLSMSEIVDLTNLPGDKLLTVKIDPNFLDSEELVPSVGEHQYYEAWPINLSADELIISCPGIYEFDHWIGDVEDPNSSTTKITLTEDKEVTAVYIAKERVCGDLCHPVLEGDLNGDCYINFVDFALYCEDWGSCTAPECD